MASKQPFKPLPQQAPPSWLADEDEKDDVKVKKAPNSVGSLAGAGPQQVEREEDQKTNAKMVWYGLKIITLFFCVLIFSTAIIRLETVTFSESPQVFVCSYMIFFSTLLFTFEAMQSQPIVWLDHMLRRNFGFLYQPLGKALFDIFLAFLCLGLTSDMALAVGIAFALFGGCQIALYLKNPSLFTYDVTDSGAQPLPAAASSVGTASV